MEDTVDDLVIRFPARSGYLNISRLNTTAVAATAGFDVEQLDDLRLAVDEAVTWLLNDQEVGGIVELVIRGESGGLDFLGRRSEPGLPARDLGDLIHAILGATVDEYRTGEDEEGRRFITMTKRAGAR